MESNEDLSWRLPILLCDLDHRGVLEHHGIFRLCPRTIGGTQGTVGLKQNVVLLAVCDELFLVEVRMAFTLQHSWLDGACTDDLGRRQGLAQSGEEAVWGEGNGQQSGEEARLSTT